MLKNKRIQHEAVGLSLSFITLLSLTSSGGSLILRGDGSHMTRPRHSYSWLAIILELRIILIHILNC